MNRIAGVLAAALPRDLDPSTDQARQWLSDELARSEYQDTRSLFQRLMDALAHEGFHPFGFGLEAVQVAKLVFAGALLERVESGM